jgi:hypothetical protein
MLIDQALHHPQQWDVTLGHCLEEPVFFEEMLMFRMTNKWKMRVKNEREVTGHRRNTRRLENDSARWIGFSEDDVNLALKAQLLPTR